MTTPDSPFRDYVGIIDAYLHPHGPSLKLISTRLMCTLHYCRGGVWNIGCSWDNKQLAITTFSRRHLLPFRVALFVCLKLHPCIRGFHSPEVRPNWPPLNRCVSRLISGSVRIRARRLPYLFVVWLCRLAALFHVLSTLYRSFRLSTSSATSFLADAPQRDELCVKKNYERYILYTYSKVI